MKGKQQRTRCGLLLALLLAKFFETKNCLQFVLEKLFY